MSQQHFTVLDTQQDDLFDIHARKLTMSLADLALIRYQDREKVREALRAELERAVVLFDSR